ncbi:MAG: LamG-like jellyroll fold domain-containing protein [Thermoguttaceae bacterium]
MKRLLMRCRAWVLPVWLAGLLSAPAAAPAGTVKVAANLACTHYFNQQNTFANVLLNFTGFGGTPGVDLTADGVSKRAGASAWYTYNPRLTPGMWPESTDDPATWYRLTYHCDADAQKNFPGFQGFTVARPPVSDGHGNWTGWLKFRERDVRDGRISVTVNYAADDLDAKGLTRRPISRLKLLQPGSADDDFLSPAFKKRARGFARFRFIDPLNMNGRQVGFFMDVPETKNTFEREGKGVLRAKLTGQAQTQTYFNGMDLNLSWGKGPGKGNHMQVFNGKKYEEQNLGIGCLASCELEYDLLGGRFLLFHTVVGIDHEVDEGGAGPHGNVTFQVWAAAGLNPRPEDYQLLREVKNLTSKTPAVTVQLDVSGKTKLKLKAIDNGDPGHAHLDLIGPRLFFIQHWTDRNLPDNYCCSMGGYDCRTCRENGIPYEYCVRACNDLGTDPWINLPCTADDDYIRNFGNLVLYGSDAEGKVYTAPGGANPRPAAPPPGWHPPLNKDLHCWVEYENEVWNWGYPSFSYHQIKGQFQHHSTYEEYAEGVKHVSDILKPLFAAAGRSDSLKIVFCNQTTGGWGDHETDATFAYIEKHYGPVSKYYDYYAEAPYCSINEECFKGSKTLDEIFEKGEKNFEEVTRRIVPGIARRAARWGLRPTTYEGGLCWEGGPIDMIRKGRADRRAGYRYDRYLQAWQAACGPDAIYQEYALFSNYEGDSWPWLAIQYCGEGLKGTPSYDGLMRNSHPAGDCDLDGKVTYADFKILAANFGGDGEKDRRWWSQGDFNNDQVVGLDDLKLLIMNTDPKAWTPAQWQELEAFLAAHPGPYVLGPDPKTHQGTWTLRALRNRPGTIRIPAQEDSGGTPTAFLLVIPPRHGEVDVSNYPALRYEPHKDYLGIDDFVIAAIDDQGRRSNPVWVAVEVGTSTDPDVIANYHFDEGSGTTTTDTGGNVATLHNGVSWTVGKCKGGMAFSWKPGAGPGAGPVPAFVKLTNAPAMDGTAYSLSLWVRPDAAPDEKSTGSPRSDQEKCVAGLLVKPSECHFGGLCYVRDEKDRTKGHFEMGHVVWFSAFPETARSAEAYAPGQWHHVVGVVDTAGQDLAAGQSPRSCGVVRIYVDGKLAGKAHHEGGILGSFFKFGRDGGNFYLGACLPREVPQRDDQFRCHGCFQGAIDEVRIYKRALSDAEVAALYQAYQRQAVED